MELIIGRKMAEEEPLPSAEQQPTTIMELNVDSLVHCAEYLGIQDIANMAMSCKFLKNVAYSDSIWQSLFRRRWSSPIPYCFSQASRRSYLARHTSSQQLKFEDPLIANFAFNLKSSDHLLLLEDDIILSQGSLMYMLMGCHFNGCDSIFTLGDHRARITCMRLYSLGDTTICGNDMQNGSSVLVTSSCDHTIRLWLKGSFYRCCRGHNGEVTTLSDKLLGDGNGKIFASGGADGTVRLWSINPKGKQGQHALRSTLYGHEKPPIHMSVARHKSSLLVSMSKDSKLRVWDTATSSSVRSSCCVGMTSVRGPPVGMKCHDSLVYVAAGSSVVSIDLRTMREASRVMHRTALHSFDILPSKSLVCTGGTGSATLWDMRRSSDTFKAAQVAELNGHAGPVKHLNMDAYKIVTGGPDDCYVKVWEAGTGALANSLICDPGYQASGFGCSAVAVKGCRIVIAGSNGEQGSLCYRDFRNAACPITPRSSLPSSKFWGSDSDTDASDESDESDVSDEFAIMD